MHDEPRAPIGREQSAAQCVSLTSGYFLVNKYAQSPAGFPSRLFSELPDVVPRHVYCSKHSPRSLGARAPAHATLYNATRA